MKFPKSYTYYTFQRRLVAQSPHLKPMDKMKDVEYENIWINSSWDNFSPVPTIDPRIFINGSTLKDRYKIARNNAYITWVRTGSHGFTTLRLAKSALKRIQKNNDLGKFDYRGPYREHVRAVRYKFRIIKVTYYFDEVEVVGE